MIIEEINHKPIEYIFEPDPKIEGFPLAYDKNLNIVMQSTNEVYIVGQFFCQSIYRAASGKQVPKRPILGIFMVHAPRRSSLHGQCYGPYYLEIIKKSLKNS